MLTHRYHMPYYQQVAVFFWPILFFELWRVDRWQAETGRRAFVVVDRYGRAWVPYWEGMTQHHHLHGMEVQAYAPSDIEALCPGWLARAFVTADASETLRPTRSGGWGIWTKTASYLRHAQRPWFPVFAEIGGGGEYFEPG